MEEVLNLTPVETREGKATLLATLASISVSQIRGKTSSPRLASPKILEQPHRARFPQFCKDINICRAHRDWFDTDYKTDRTKAIVFFPVCCLTIVLQISETSEWLICVLTVVICEMKKTENYTTDISLRILTLM